MTIKTLLFFGLLALSLTGLVGCHLGQPGSASFASVVVQHHTPAEIESVTDQVFQQNGYAAYTLGSGRWLYEKEGTQANNLAYNGIVATHEGAMTLVRVKTELVDLGAGTFRLQCQTYMVRNAEDSFFEEETRLSNFRSGPYQELLDEIGRRLK